MRDVAFIVGAYGAGAAGVVGYAVSVVRRERQARERRDALHREHDKFADETAAAHPVPVAAERSRPPNTP